MVKLLQIADEVSSYTNTWKLSGIDPWNLEFVNVGIVNETYPRMVALRERVARQAPDGTWQRIYGLADGSVQTATSYDGNFEAWEKANTDSPAQYLKQ